MLTLTDLAMGYHDAFADRFTAALLTRETTPKRLRGRLGGPRPRAGDGLRGHGDPGRASFVRAYECVWSGRSTEGAER
jgi:hypothetical protein